MKNFRCFKKIILLLAILGSHSAFAGPSSGGGGDAWTIDFTQVAEKEVLPWLIKYGASIQPVVNVEDYKQKISDLTERLQSKLHVFESCDLSTNGREVGACYNYITDHFYVSQTLYPLDLKNSPAKRLLVMHEIFRRMKIEGDKYEITRKLNVNITNPELSLGCVIKYYQEGQFKSTPEKALAIEACEKFAADDTIQKCVLNLVKTGDFSTYDQKVLAVDACQRTSASAQMQNFVLSLVKQADFKSTEEKSMAIDTFFRQGL